MCHLENRKSGELILIVIKTVFFSLFKYTQLDLGEQVKILTVFVIYVLLLTLVIR